MKSQAYAFYLQDQNELQKSSSGGAFTALSDAVFAQNGTVIACNYNYDIHEMGFDTAEETQMRNQMRGSKYIQANSTNLYIELAQELSKADSSPLLIIGTPCQVAGAKVWIKYKQVITNRKVIYCDLLCHGVSSPQMWKKYITLQENKYQEKIKYVTFKDKRKGWLRPTAIAVLDSGRDIEIEDYAILYRSKDFMRPSCYHCKYASIRRDTDITIGDFWGIDKVAPSFVNFHGTSLILVHTITGQRLFEKAVSEGKCRLSEFAECLQSCMEYPVKPSLRFKDIHEDYDKYGLPYIIEKYVHYGPGLKSLRRLRRKWFRMKYQEN